jgi:hypothetical protein
MYIPTQVQKIRTQLQNYISTQVQNYILSDGNTCRGTKLHTYIEMKLACRKSWYQEMLSDKAELQVCMYIAFRTFSKVVHVSVLLRALTKQRWLRNADFPLARLKMSWAVFLSRVGSDLSYGWHLGWPSQFKWCHLLLWSTIFFLISVQLVANALY